MHNGHIWEATPETITQMLRALELKTQLRKLLQFMISEIKEDIYKLSDLLTTKLHTFRE